MSPSDQTSAAPRRDMRLDFLRGFVMVLMALDHVRDYFGGDLPKPTDLSVTTPALFFTRWVTHFCAPSFVFLAGMGAALSLRAGKTRGELSRFLVTRGLWLILLEVTVVRFAWQFELTYTSTTLQVIWALGVSMVVLAALIHLPMPVIAAFGILLVCGHNLTDSVHLDSPLWLLVHQRGRIPLTEQARLFVMYPLVPWVGLMALGYVTGSRFRELTRMRLILIGAALIGAFVLLRATGIYGDPNPFRPGPSLTLSVLGFLNCEKYPPSLDYLLMTVGPLILSMGLLAPELPKLSRPVVTLGRVPLLYYVLHLYLIHGAARLMRASGTSSLGLSGVWLVWIAIVVALYPVCRWYADLKAKRSDLPWLSYL